MAAALLLLAAPLAAAQNAPLAAPGAATESSTGLNNLLEQQVREMALSVARSGARSATPTPTPPRIELSIGQLDPRLRLAPCQHVEPYLPDGTRLWGKSRIGLRCTRGTTKWNVYLPITIKVFAQALVATAGATSGSVLGAADLAQAEVDLAEEPSSAITNLDFAVGRVLARNLKPGQSLRQTHLKARQWFAAGDTVTVSAEGDGFSVAGEGQALTNGIEGQAVRVRTDNGRVISGLPVGDRRVALSL